MKYEELKRLWTKNGEAPGIGALKTNVYCLRFSQYGSTGPCGSGVLTTEVFKDAPNALAWLRFSVIPFVLDLDSNPNNQDGVRPAEEYLGAYDAPKKKAIGDLLKEMDKTMCLKAPDKKTMARVLTKYNKVFSTTNPESSILAHGHLPDFIFSKYILKEISEILSNNEDDTELRELFGLLITNRFIPADKKHMGMIANLLEQMDEY